MVPVDSRHVLDVGCSNGALGARIRAELPGCQVTGIEASPLFCSEAARRLNRVIEADLNVFDWRGSFKDEKFDCIVLADVLEHLVEPWSALRRGSTLPPPRRRAGDQPAKHQARLGALEHLRAGHLSQARTGILDRTHLRWFTIGDAVQLTKDAGLTIERMDFGLRVVDRGDAFVNKLGRKLFGRFAGVGPIREFLTYQYVFRALRPTGDI